MRTPSSARSIEDVDLVLKALKLFYRKNGAAVEGLTDINKHRIKDVGEGGSFSWVCAQTKGEGCECELTKKMFFHSDFFQLCLEKKGRSLSSSLTQLFFTIKNSRCERIR